MTEDPRAEGEAGMHYPVEHSTSPEVANDDSQMILTGAESPGVARIEALNAHLTLTDRICLSIGVFFIAYAYGLDSTIRSTYQVCSATKNILKFIIGIHSRLSCCLTRQ